MSARQEKSIADKPDSPSGLSLEDFSYELPPELIAQEPARERSSSRLMLLNRSERSIEHRSFSDIAEYLRPGDSLVINDTKVIPARIKAWRSSGGQVEILLLKPEADRPGIWQAMASPLRKLKSGESLKTETPEGETFFIKISGFCASPEGQRRILIDLGGQAETYALLSKIGKAPLPPYILRERGEKIPVNDNDRYQTVYASSPGAVAAPTAGLHFTEELLGKLKEKGVRVVKITLHVGPGTFKPIISSLDAHSIESEEFRITPEAADIVNNCRRSGGRVIAVGTTSCRTLETAGASGEMKSCEHGQSSLYIRPGHKFAMVDALVTNFHLSRSSLLVLVSAFAGHEFIMSAYKEAVEQKYRFYSYGDAMLII